MSEWKKEHQENLEVAISRGRLFAMSQELQRRALDCVRLCAGHADLTKCEVNPAGTSNDLHLMAIDLQSKDAELATLRAELTHANQVIAQQAGQIATLREQLSDANGKLDEFYKMMAPMMAQYDEAAPELERLTDENANLREQLAAAQADPYKGQWKRRAMHAEEQVKELREQLSSAERAMRIQANAVRNLRSAELAQATHLHDAARKLAAESKPELVESERSANAILTEENDRLRDQLSAAQARIDELMLEYCPDEMTPEQIAEWGRLQRDSKQRELCERAMASVVEAGGSFSDLLTAQDECEKALAALRAEPNESIPADRAEVIATLESVATMCSYPVTKHIRSAIAMLRAGAVPHEPVAWLVEFDELQGDGSYTHTRHLVFDKPEGHYAECAFPLYQNFLDEWPTAAFSAEAIRRGLLQAAPTPGQEPRP